MNHKTKISKFLHNPFCIIPALGFRGYLNWIPDKVYLKMLYWIELGKKLNLDNPQTFNEKLQWLKLYDRKPEYAMMVDKYEARKYIADTIGEEYLIPLVGGPWDRFEDIDFNALPDQFVLKCTHDSGSVIICQDKSALDIGETRKKLNTCLVRNLYWHCREWPYKNVKPRIIAEKYMGKIQEGAILAPEDYKIYCFNDVPRLIVVFHDRFNPNKEKSETVYNTEWERQPYSLDAHFQISDIVEPCPKCLDELLTLSAKLCKGFPQIRTDFYIIEGKIYFGELTLHTAAGLISMNPTYIDEMIGNWFVLPLKVAKN